jgi:autotransporter-associated beta strand protein
MSRHQQQWRTRLTLVRLEDRAVPANLIWTGDVDNHWGTNQLGNTNWAFDLLPHNGDSLVFPASSQNHSNSNNISGLVLNSITMQYDLAVISGNGITLTGNLTESAIGSADQFTMPMTLSAGAHTFTISSFVSLNRLGESGVASLVKEGAGALQFQSSNTCTGLTTINAGTLILENNSGVSINGNLLINGGTVQESLDYLDHIADTSAVTVNSEGTLDLHGHFDTIGSLHVAAGGRLNLRGDAQGNLHTSSLSLDSGSTVSMQIGQPDASDDIIVPSGPVHLGGMLDLQIGTFDPIGRSFTLISNSGSAPITGMFDGLPQNAVMDVAGHLHTIDYAGGDGNDAVVTRRPDINVTSVRVNDGAVQRSCVTSLTLTFSDPATFSITPGTAFTLVRFSDGAIVQFDATATLVNGVTVVTLANFGGNATEFGSLADGRYLLTALANQITFSGEPLDGNADGTAGDNFATVSFRFFGDVNGDQIVNGLDFGFFKSAFGTQVGDPNYLGFLDFNGDGVINGFDFGQFKLRFGTTLP